MTFRWKMWTGFARWSPALARIAKPCEGSNIVEVNRFVAFCRVVKGAYLVSAVRALQPEMGRLGRSKSDRGVFVGDECPSY